MAGGRRRTFPNAPIPKARASTNWPICTGGCSLSMMYYYGYWEEQPRCNNAGLLILLLIDLLFWFFSSFR
jgi:hypothetical protein